MDLLDHLRTMGGYNAWANGRLYETVSGLDDAHYRADRGVFFRSVHGTLNHLLVTDAIWMGRLMEAGAPPPALDAILHDDFIALQAARETEDRRIVAFVETLAAEDLDRTVRYRRVTTPDFYEQALAHALAHLFNHQTHHRGQVHAVLTGLGRRAPELDLLVYQRLVGFGARRVDG